MSTQEEEIRLHVEQAKQLVARSESLTKLFKNKDFKEVILEGYLKEEAVRLVLLKADPATLTDEMQAVIDKGINAIGSFNQYLKMVQALGEQAARSLKDYEEYQAELLAEGE